MKKLKTIVIIIFISFVGNLRAQESVNSSGGNAIGSAGEIEYSIGQITYNKNANGTSSVSQGVQQAFEISETLSTNNTENIELQLTAFPNPTTNYLTLSFGEKNSTTIAYQLFDVTGKMLQSKSNLQNKETLPMQKFSSGIYYLKVSEKNNIIKTFKIIKN